MVGPEPLLRPSASEPPASGRARRQAEDRAPAQARARAERLVAPLVVALVPLFWVVDATRRAALTTLGRDQGIFQYVAWAVSRGEVDYRDVRDVNGPLIHLLHHLFLKLGGGDEHRFHQLELWSTGLAFAFVGACLPGIAGRRVRTRLDVVERCAWALAAWVVLAGQYQLFTYWNQAQRESFCDMFLLPSLALQLLPAPRDARGARVRLAAIFALSSITWLGKPTFVLFTAMQGAVALFDREGPLSRRTKLPWIAVGAALGVLPPLLYLVVKGDPVAFFRTSLIDVPQVYRFIWAKSAQEILGEEGPLSTAAFGLAASALVVALVAVRELPRRALAIGLAPLAGLGNVIAQHKGFDYHFHPLTASTWLVGLVVLARLASRARSRTRRLVTVGAATALAVTCAWCLRLSPQLRNVWILAGGETAELRTFPAYFGTFKTADFFPWEMREAAAYLERVTSPDARVQTYGMDPYILFLAGRRSATPYIYAYDLNANAALEGGWSATPTDAQRAVIAQKRDEHEADMLARLRASPPEAFVFHDHAPLITYQEAWEDFRRSCPESARWVAENYHPARSFGDEVHVWLRDGLPVKDEMPPPGVP